MDFSIASILTLDGVTNGAIYALLALATVLVFAITRVIFIPQGEFVAYGAITLAMLQGGNPVGSVWQRWGDLPGTVWLLLVVALLAVVIDLFNREVVGWAIKPRMTADIVTDALTMAWFRRRPASGLIFHSDRGSQYASGDFQKQLKAFGMLGSMSRKGDCWDNAVTETLFGSLKVERLHGIRFGTRRAAKDEVMDWLQFYNHRRLHSTLGYLSPMNFEKAQTIRKMQLAGRDRNAA